MAHIEGVVTFHPLPDELQLGGSGGDVAEVDHSGCWGFVLG